jgi:hypothetical protein
MLRCSGARADTGAMTEWIWSGVMALDVPEGWRTEIDGHVLELVPPDDAGAAHISVLERTREEPPVPGEAAGLATSFAEHVGELTGDVAERSDAERRVATATARGGGFLWWIEAHVTASQAFMCTLNYEASAAHLVGDARATFASLEPSARVD